MFKIERALTTLLGTYKLFSQGNLPRLVNEYVQPSMDLLPHALAACGVKVQNFPTPATGVAVGTLATYVQPEDWWIVATDIQNIAAAANDQAMVWLSCSPAGIAGPAFRLCSTLWTGSTASNSNAGGAGWQRPMIYTPLVSPLITPKGTLWSLECGSFTGAGQTITALLVHYKLSDLGNP